MTFATIILLEENEKLMGTAKCYQAVKGHCLERYADLKCGETEKSWCFLANLVPKFKLMIGEDILFIQIFHPSIFNNSVTLINDTGV